MNAILRMLGFPAPEHQGIVTFYVARSLPYATRVVLIWLFLIAGFGLQWMMVSVFPGVPFLIAAVSLILAKGYDSRVRLKTLQIDPNWTQVTMDQIRELDQLRKKNRQWDKDALDISNPMGFFTFILIGGAAAMFAVGMGIVAQDPNITVILLTDTIILLVPVFFTGMKFILKQPALAIKVDLMLKLATFFDSIKKPAEEFVPSMMLAQSKDAKSVPSDVKFSIRIPGLPSELYGLQAQININMVQGHSYPYFYCVIVSKSGFGLSKYPDRISLDANIICEYQQDDDAEVLIIRQHTTKKSGYHTQLPVCQRILTIALNAVREIG